SEVILHNAPQVFITYAHDSTEHRDSVRRFAGLLQRHGAVVRFDQWDQGIRQEGPKWTMDQMMTADFNVVIASPAFLEAAMRAAIRSSNRAPGVELEASILRDRVHGGSFGEVQRILPVVLPGGSVDDFPPFLLPYIDTHYQLAAITSESAEALLRV